MKGSIVHKYLIYIPLYPLYILYILNIRGVVRLYGLTARCLAGAKTAESQTKQSIQSILF